MFPSPKREPPKGDAMKLFLPLFLLGGLWDAFTTFWGSYQILGNSYVQFATSIGFALTIAGFMFGTRAVWAYKEHEFFALFLKFLWLVAFAYDLYTAFLGCSQFVLPRYATTEQLALLLGVTILSSGSPIAFSYLAADPPSKTPAGQSDAG